MAYTFETLKVVMDEGVAILSLNRPEKYNPLSFQMLGDLHDALPNCGLTRR